MNDTTQPAADGSRLEEFQQDVDKLKVTGGRANPERWMFRLGFLLALAGVIIALVAFIASGNATDARDQTDMVILAIFGLGLTVVGATLVVINSFTRFMRYWLVRLIYEHREQTDRVVND